MPYVMVPVPEEHVEDVMNFMLRAMARANLLDWDDEAMIELFDESDEITRTLLAVVARSAEGETDLLEEDASRKIQLSQRETAAIVRELNENARDRNRPNVMVRQPTTQVMPNGRTIEKPALVMEPEVAACVIAAEKADLAANPLPGQ